MATDNSTFNDTYERLIDEIRNLQTVGYLLVDSGTGDECVIRTGALIDGLASDAPKIADQLFALHRAKKIRGAS